MSGALHPLHTTPPAFRAPASHANVGEESELCRIIGLVVLAITAIFAAIVALFSDDPEPHVGTTAGIDLRTHDHTLKRSTAGSTTVVPEARVALDAARKATADYRINPALLSTRPPPIKDLLAQLRNEPEIRRIEVGELLTWFNTVYQDATGREERAQRAADKQLIEDYIRIVTLRLDNFNRSPTDPLYGADATGVLPTPRRDRSTTGGYGPTYWNTFFDQVELMAQGVIYLLRNPETPLHKKQGTLRELAAAAAECRTRLLEDTMRQYKLLAGGGGSLRDKLLTIAQEVKEGIILKKYCRSEPVHILGQVRQSPIGRDWGLEEVTIRDPHAGAGRFVASEVTAELTKHYTPENLADAVRTRLLFDADWRSVNDYFQTHMSEEDDFTEYYDQVGTGRASCMVINHVGVTRLLTITGLLSRTA